MTSAPDPSAIHRRAAEGRAARPPGRLGVRADGARAGQPLPRRGRADRRGGARRRSTSSPTSRTSSRSTSRSTRWSVRARTSRRSWSASPPTWRASRSGTPRSPRRRTATCWSTSRPRTSPPRTPRGRRTGARRARRRARVDLRHPRRARPALGPAHDRLGRAIRARRAAWDSGSAGRRSGSTARSSPTCSRGLGRSGWRSVPHAGETTGPATVWAALRAARADRIGHGIASVARPRAGGLPGRARHPARGVPDVEPPHPSGGADRGPPVPRAARRRRHGRR